MKNGSAFFTREVKLFTLFLTFCFCFYACKEGNDDIPLPPPLLIDSTMIPDADRYFSRALELANKNQHSESIDTVQKALAIYEFFEMWNHYVEANGVLARNYVQIGDFELVEQINKKSMQIIKENNLPANQGLGVYFLSGTVNQEKGLYQAAFDDFEIVLNFLIENDTTKGPNGEIVSLPLSAAELNGAFGHTYNYAAFSILGLGEFEKALDYFKKAKRHYELINAEDRVLTSFINIGSVYLNMGEHEEALFWFNKVRNATEGKEPYLYILASTYNYLASIYKEQEQYQQEHKYLQKLTVLLEDSKMKNLHSHTGVGMATAKLSLAAKKALNQMKLGKKKEALSLANSTFEQVTDLTVDAEIVAISLLYMSRIYSDAGQEQQALVALQKGLKALFPELEEDTTWKNPQLEKIDFKISAIGLLAEKAKTLFQLSEKQSGTEQIQLLELALNTSDLSINVLEKIRGHLFQAVMDNVAREGSIFSFENKFPRLFDLNMSIAHQLYEVTKKEQYLEMTFQTAERSKAYILQQNLNKVDQLNGFPVALREQLHDLESELFFFEKKIAAAKRNQQEEVVDRLEEQLFVKEESYRGLIDDLRTNPETKQYYTEQYATTIRSTTDIQTFLAKQNNTALIEIYEGEEHIYVFSISDNQRMTKVLPKGESWEKDILQLNALNINRNLLANKDLIETYLEINDRIYQTLLAETLNSLDPKVKHLMIVPHGMTHYVNFSLLLDSKKMPEIHNLANLSYPIADCSTFDYLVKKYSIGTALSATIFLNENNKERLNESFDLALLGFVPDYEKRNACESKNGRLPIANLPDEVSPLKTYFDESQIKVIDGASATEAQFREMIKQYSTNILHISAHGQIDAERPLYSKLLFANCDSGDDFNNDLEVGELYNLEVNTQLAILSACSSGDGQLKNGHERISLARGFAYANCPTIIMSQWDLDVASNLTIMQSLYRYLVVEQLPIDVSLQQAQLNYLMTQRQRLENTSDPTEQEALLKNMHPYFWGGLVPIGRMTPLAISPL